MPDDDHQPASAHLAAPGEPSGVAAPDPAPAAETAASVPAQASDHDPAGPPAEAVEAPAVDLAAADATEVGPATRLVGAPTKTAARKAPATKAAARKAPATKAAARKAPATKAPARKAPATTARTASGRTTGAAAQASPRKAPARRAQQEAVAADELRVPDLVPGLVSEPEPAPSGLRAPGWVRPLVALTVLLLSGAAGLGAAALVTSGEHVWTASAAVRLSAPEAPTKDPRAALRSVLDRYTAAVASTTSAAQAVTGVRDEDLRGDLSGAARGDDVVVVTAEAATGDQASVLARAGADAVARAVTADQASVRQGDRVAASVEAPTAGATRTHPSSARAGAAGALAAGAILVLGLLVTLRPPSAH